MNTQNNYSDLIQLFLDGECTEVESSVLFSEMSKNPQLQAEFQQAAQFGVLMRSQQQMVKPPVDLSGMVMSKVGLATTSAVATSVFSIGKILSALGLVSLGVVSAVVALRFIPNSSSAENVQHVTQQLQQPQVTFPVQSEQHTNTTTEQQPKQVIKYVYIQQPLQQPLQQQTVQHQPVATEQHPVEAHSDTEHELTIAEAPTTLQETPNTTTEVMQFAPTMVYGFQSLQQQPQPRYVSPVVAHSDVVISPPEGHSSWFSPRYISLRSAVPIGKLLSQASIETGDRIFSLQWPISPTGSFGIELGRAYLPTYAVISQDNIKTFVKEDYIGWFSLSMREDGRPEFLQSITPNDDKFHWTGELSIGLSNAGIITKAETYATYNIFNSISVSAGPTAIIQFLGNQGNAQVATRFALMFGAGYEF
ncbi:MAG: hypothetical protein U0Y96_04545 [Candidatus Kapaibacterium sp.]